MALCVQATHAAARSRTGGDGYRTNVETVIVAGKVRKWNGKLRNVNLVQLRNQLEDSRDYIFARAGIPQGIFRKN
jgi:5-methylthioadenosine/S-adenosylhomocysteine deaminase